MPRRKKSQMHSSDESLDEQYIPSTSQSQSHTPALASKDVEKYAGQVCNLLLVAEMKKIPVKSADIKKSISTLKKKASFQSVMEKAGELMQHVFGYKIMLVKGNCYMLANTMGSTFAKYEQLSKKECISRGILIALLSAIFMSEGRMSADNLEKYLRDLNVNVTGAAKPIIQSFIRKKYLETTLDESTDPPTVMYHWGERAHVDFCKKSVLEFVCKVYGDDMQPTAWTYQWQMIKEEKKKE